MWKNHKTVSYNTITDFSNYNDTTYTLIYSEHNEQMRIFFSGYEFLCRPNRVQPSFYYAGVTDFSDWVNRHLNYPKEAIQKQIEGQVMLKFMVDSDGYVKNVQVIESVNPILDEELSELSHHRQNGPLECLGKFLLRLGMIFLLFLN